MPTPASVQKRTGETVPFKAEKIYNAAYNALIEVNEETADEMANKAQTKTINKLKKAEETIPSVDQVHQFVEESLMDLKQYDAARAYFSYRKEHMPDIFRPRTAYKPFEYPQLAIYVDAIQKSYWIVTEFGFTSDIQDFKSVLPFKVKESLRRSTLTISQVEVDVKKFWSRIGDVMPKPEIEEVASVFGESEVRHSRAYSHLLEILGLNAEFDKILEVPAIQKRVEYAKKAIKKSKTDSSKEFMESVLLFSLFIENVSLFSQFLIISQTNKSMNGAVSGMANVVGATSLEEQIHAMFGADLINIMRKENPEWFDDALQERLHTNALEAYDAECDIIDWIFEEGELDYLTKAEIREYIKKRFNMGFVDAGFDPLFDLDEKLLERVNWFDVQNNSTSHQDFFAGRSGNYEKFDASFNEDEIF